MTIESVAIEALFRLHHGWLKSWLARRFRNVGSEDIASEVFLRLITRSDANDLREPRAMMTTIACRLVNEIRRRTGLWQKLEDELLLEQQDVESSPEDRLVLKEALLAIDAVISTLGPNARAAFLLSRVDGLSTEEIASRLNVSTRTVERYLAKGMRRALDQRRDQ